MVTAETILDLLHERKLAYGPVVAKALELRNVYNGDIVVPLPELSQDEQSSVANLVALGLDQTAQRIASTLPEVRFPVLGQRGSKRQEEASRDRRAVTMGWWESNRMRLKMRRRARWLIGYATAPVIIRPPRAADPTGTPRWHLRDPLSTYPAQSDDPDEICPDDCIFTFTRRWGWLNRRYPNESAVLRRDRNTTADTPFEIVEYVDGDQLVLLAVGSKTDSSSPWAAAQVGAAAYVELERIPNRAGMCLAVVPGRITLDRRQGQYDSVVGLFQQQAKLMALEVLAVQRGVFPETWLIGQAGQNPQIVVPANAMTGEVGVVKNGQLDTIQVNPSFATLQNVDRLERAQRITAGIPAEFGGESNANIRTGRRGDAILSAVIDFPIQEAQDILAAAIKEENRRAIALTKAYGGSRKRTVFIPARGGKTEIAYAPTGLFPTDEHDVYYAQPGADVNGLVIAGGQRIGIGTMSKRSFMEIDPLVDDPEAEEDRVTAEALRAAFLSSIQTQAANPQGPFQPVDMARLVQLVRTDRLELEDAVAQVQREAQQRQTTPTALGTPEAAPGLSPPGEGAEAGLAVQEPEPSVSNLATLFSQLRRPAMTIPAEQGAA